MESSDFLLLKQSPEECKSKWNIIAYDIMIMNSDVSLQGNLPALSNIMCKKHQRSVLQIAICYNALSTLAWFDMLG
jgi:phosphodiesterase/alkaline phosphatase D-like protein